MNENIINTGDAGNTTANEAPDTTPVFTQGDLDRVVGERLHRERAKITADFASREEELKKREYQMAARDTLMQRGYAGESLQILGVLNAKTVDELNNALDVLEKHARVGGERFDAAVLAGINDKLKQKPPETRFATGGDTIRKGMGLK